jgi:choline dehydrogenase-like flavoprotein
MVGRGLTDHHFDLLVGVLPGDAGLSRGPASAARADFPGRGSMEQVGNMPGVIAEFTMLTDSGTVGTPGNNQTDPGTAGADTVGRLAGNALKDLYRDIDRLMVLLVLTDDDVEPQKNFVALSGASDEHGRIPQVVMDGRNRSARTKRNREYIAQKAVGILKQAQAQRILRVNLQPVLLHMQSSMRMGANPADSVLDSNAEARSVQRLFVADHSALANALGGPNPTLTSQALATRTAEKIFRRYFGGDPWVRSESPVSSIDLRVTAAVLHSVYA